jgi:outer membrane lipoprotein-sorting protein
MQFSRVISGFCTLLLMACGSTAHSESFPDEVMTPQASPAPEAKKSVEKKPEAKTSKAKPDTAKTPDSILLAVGNKYKNAKSVAMDIDRKLVIGLLGKEKNAKGTLILSKGKMRMELATPEKSIVVIDGKTLWVADYPAAEFKNAAVQVLKGKIDSKKAANQTFVGALSRGGLPKEFQATGSMRDEKQRTVLFLTPRKQNGEFKRAQLVLAEDNMTIAELRYWDDRDNATTMTFSNVKFDVPVSKKTFEFAPPENADITTI